MLWKTLIESFVSSFEEVVKGEVLNDNYSLGMYATDASIYQLKPVAIVIPKDEKDVKKAVALSLGTQDFDPAKRWGHQPCRSVRRGVLVLDFSKYMNKVLEINAEEKWVRVQPGKVRDELNAELARHNLHFAPDPATSSRANVGGMVGNNSSGMKSILYGKTVDHVLEARVLLGGWDRTDLKATTFKRGI